MEEKIFVKQNGKKLFEIWFKSIGAAEIYLRLIGLVGKNGRIFDQQGKCLEGCYGMYSPRKVYLHLTRDEV